MNTSMSLFQKILLFLSLIIFVTIQLEVPTPTALSNIAEQGGGCEKVAAAPTTTITARETKTEVESKDYNNEYEYKPFNQTNPHLDSWCPYAQCYNSPICTPCNRRFLFIIATGRSGSTTLLKMLNLLPNVRISGENYNELYFASQLIENIEKDKVNFYDAEPMKKKKKKANEQGNDNNDDDTNAGLFMHKAVEDGAFMHNAMPVGSMSCIMQKVIFTLNPPDLSLHKDNNKNEKSGNGGGGLLQYLNHPEIEDKQILGVKTIRLQKSPNEEFTPYKAKKYLTENFPCARFIINVRSDAEAQAQSVINAFKRDDYEYALEDFKNQTKFLISLAHFLNNNNNEVGSNINGNGNDNGNSNDNSDRARLIDMEDWKDDVSILNDLLNWLGFEKCSFPKILHENLNGYEHDSSEISLGKQCVYPNL